MRYFFSLVALVLLSSSAAVQAASLPAHDLNVLLVDSIGPSISLHSDSQRRVLSLEYKGQTTEITEVALNRMLVVSKSRRVLQMAVGAGSGVCGAILGAGGGALLGLLQAGFTDANLSQMFESLHLGFYVGAASGGFGGAVGGAYTLRSAKDESAAIQAVMKAVSGEVDYVEIQASAVDLLYALRNLSLRSRLAPADQVLTFATPNASVNR